MISSSSGLTIIAGEAVQVDALSSSLGGGTPLNSSLMWNFGDPNGEYNVLPGFNAAHIYTTPGTYHITLTIKSGDGTQSTATQQVTVTPDNRQVIYVSNSGNDNASGTSPDQAIASLSRAQQLINSNTVIALQDGSTFDLSQTFQIDGYHDVTITSYGSGAKPELLWTGARNGSSLISDLTTAYNVVIENLTFDSIYNQDVLQNGIPFGILASGTNLAVVGNTFLNLDYAVNANGVPNGLLVQDNTAPLITGLRGYFVWLQGDDIVILGNTVANSTQEHNVRGYATGVLIAYNNLTNIQTDPTGAAKTCIALQGGSFDYVYHNTINAGGYIDFGPVSTDAPAALASADEEIDWVVCDSNLIYSYIDVQPGTAHILVSNNVIINPDTSLINVAGYDSQYNRIVSDLQIINNTGIDTSVGGRFLALFGAADGITLDYNLFVAPQIAYGVSEASAIWVDQNDLSSFTQIQNNIWPESTWLWHTNNGLYYVGTAVDSLSAYVTIQQVDDTGVGSGDTMQNVTLTTTYYVTANGVAVGSDLS